MSILTARDIIANLRVGDEFAMTNMDLRHTPQAQALLRTDAFGAALLQGGGVHRAVVQDIIRADAWEVKMIVWVPQFDMHFTTILVANMAVTVKMEVQS